uniref:Uncharacterized protein LOC116938946 isoform X1 n=1 Tax=Petromyzon marinus TaxID=7757 RepID=A0AAJ7WM26_PETMA|nr:uncharacterized protein LOC116938946 isoform X1 [Petromyzon marinus]XP_032802596.1 uncharacterized protein LOC116938946 isoform X1 [Petromyzon marinus]
MSESSGIVPMENVPMENVPPSETQGLTPGQGHKLRDGIPMSLGTPFRGARELPRSPLATPGQPTQLKLDFSENSDVSRDASAFERVAEELNDGKVGKRKAVEHEEMASPKRRLIDYPKPGNLLHPGRQIPRTPAPGILPALPSQLFYYEACDIDQQGPVAGQSDLLVMPAKHQTTQPDKHKKGKEKKLEPMKIVNKLVENLASNTIPTGRQLPRTPPTDVPSSEETPAPTLEQTAAPGGRQNNLPSQAACETHENPALQSQVEPANLATAEDMHKLDGANTSNAIAAEIMDDNQRGVNNQDVENTSQFAEQCLKVSLPNNEVEDQTTGQINTNAEANTNCSIPLTTGGVAEVKYMVKELGGYEQCTPDLVFLEHKRHLDLLSKLKEEHLLLTRQHKKLAENKEYIVASLEKVQQDADKMTEHVMSTVQQALKLQGSGGRSIEDLADAIALLPSLNIALLRRQQQLQAARGKQLSLEVERRTAELLAEKSHLELAIREKQEEYQKVVVEASVKLQQEEGEVKKLQAVLERHKQSVKATKLKTSELHRALQEDLRQSEGGAREAAVPPRDPEQQRAKARLRRLKQRKECAERREKMINDMLAKPLSLTYRHHQSRLTLPV